MKSETYTSIDLINKGMRKKTKQFFVAALAFLSIALHQNAAAQSFKVGTTAINVGVGFLSTIGYAPGYSRSPVLSLTGEYGIVKAGPGVIGGGLAFGYQGASHTYYDGPYYEKGSYSTVLFGIRGTYHPDFLNSDKYDVYGIVQLSYAHFSYSYTTNDPSFYNTNYYYSGSSLGTYIRPYLLVGARYYFSKTFGVYSELGYDISFLKLGATIKF